MLFTIPRWIQYTLYAIAAIIAVILITGLGTWVLYYVSNKVVGHKEVCGTYCHQVTTSSNDTFDTFDTFCFSTCIKKENFDAFNLPDL